MYVGWTEYACSIVEDLFRINLRHVKRFTMYNYSVWAQSRRSKLWNWLGFRIVFYLLNKNKVKNIL